MEHLIVELGNHAKIRAILEQYLSPQFFKEYDTAVRNATLRFIRLSEQHLRAAILASKNKKLWRTTVSRAYYACYSASRALRYLVTGNISMGEVADHKKIGELPNDFPDRLKWADVLVEMRNDRNLADYQPWSNSLKELAVQPSLTLVLAENFVREAKKYLKSRGVRI